MPITFDYFVIIIIISSSNIIIAALTTGLDLIHRFWEFVII